MTVNRVILVGNLGKDPEVRFTPSGKAVANFSLATSEKWTTQDGQKQEHTEWHRIIVWGKSAENCGQYLAKGRSVYIEGKLRTREYEDRDGVKRRITEVVADNVRFLASGGRREESRDTGRDDGGSGGAQGSDDDDIPF